MIVVAADPAQPGHAGRERADAGHHQAVGARGRRAASAVTVDVGADPRQRPLGRAQVARPVVEHDDRRALGCHLRYRARPWCDGTPCDPRVELDGGAQRAGDRLELGLDDVVRVAAVEHVDVQGRSPA